MKNGFSFYRFLNILIKVAAKNSTLHKTAHFLNGGGCNLFKLGCSPPHQ